MEILRINRSFCCSCWMDASGVSFPYHGAMYMIVATEHMCSNTRRMVHPYTHLALLRLPPLSLLLFRLASPSPAFRFCSRPPLPSPILQDASKQQFLDLSTTPPLTPASAISSPIVATSVEYSKKTTNSFFANSYYDAGGSSGTDASSSDEGMESSQILQQVSLPWRPSLRHIGEYAWCGTALPW